VCPPNASKPATAGTVNGLQEIARAAGLIDSLNSEPKGQAQGSREYRTELRQADRRRIAAEMAEIFGPWDEHYPKLTHLPMVVRWHDDIQFRIWREKALLHRIGCVSDSWEGLLRDVDCFRYVTGGLADELAPPKEEVA
jgi:hypothetical protein